MPWCAWWVSVSGLLLLRREEVVWQSFAAVAAGFVYGVVVFRWGTRWGWVSAVLVFGILGIALLWAVRSSVWGPVPLLWIGGAVVGSNVGGLVECREADGEGPKREHDASQVEGRGGGGVPRAVENRGGRAEWGVSPKGRLMLWEVLASQGSRDDVVEVPMGGPVGRIPQALICDESVVRAVVEAFQAGKGSTPEGRLWEAGNVAEGTRPRP